MDKLNSRELELDTAKIFDVEIKTCTVNNQTKHCIDSKATKDVFNEIISDNDVAGDPV
jgi:hypothetical protein